MRWYCRYPVSYHDLEAMMTERSVGVDHSTIYRRVQRFAPEMEKHLRWQWRRPQSRSWRIDETYIMHLSRLTTFADSPRAACSPTSAATA